MYALRVKLPPEQRLAAGINSVREQTRKNPGNVAYVTDRLSSTVFTEACGGQPLSKSCTAELNEATGKFDLVFRRDHQGWRRLLDWSRLNRIFTAAAAPDLPLRRMVKHNVDFLDAIKMLKAFDAENKSLEVYEGPRTIHTHYTFAQALLNGKKAEIEIEPEAFIGRPEPKPAGCECQCNCAARQPAPAP